MTTVHRIVYSGVCEILVETDGVTITRVLAATAGDLVGRALDDLPRPKYIEARLMVGYGPCASRIYHGPGHQSSTGCRLRGEHTEHEAVYGEFNQYATWIGGDTHSGAFDEPPENRVRTD